MSFDGDELCAGQSPRADHAYGADAAAEVERGLRGGTPTRAIPGGEDVVGGEAVSVAQLEQAKMSADGIERFVWFNCHARGESRRDRAGLGPSFEMGGFAHNEINSTRSFVSK